MQQPSIISARNIGKRYQLGIASRHNTLRDRITESARNLFSSKKRDAESGEFWALNDVSFDVAQGDVVGVIGRNGAGKSTLLKVLSQITEPTRGEIHLRGRVASLLEVGTGFHPELNGRENIFLNGAILGMTRAEIRKKFDEIVAFAGVEKFLETPVKRYSSGMYVRLAFAVAAHLEPEILIVDEVLAVGDAAFQKKCLGKMQEVGKSGRTVLFVSHNMAAVLSLCTRCLMLEGGSLKLDTTPQEAVNRYLRETAVTDCFTRPAQPNGLPTIVGGSVHVMEETQTVSIALEISSGMRERLAVDLRLLDATGMPVAFGSLGSLDEREQIDLHPGITKVSLTLPTHQLALGSYYVGLDLNVPFVRVYDRADSCFEIKVIRSAATGGNRCLTQTWGYGSYEIPIVNNAKAEASPLP
jgi:lipopolysaccharide transport system ATP-binding protein